MQRLAFRMVLLPGQMAEYRKRHDEIWPDLASLLKEAGICNYSIHLDEETNMLLAYLERPDDHRMEDLPDHPVMKKWWAHMKDIMEYEGDRPRVTLLTEMFYLR